MKYPLWFLLSVIFYYGATTVALVNAAPPASIVGDGMDVSSTGTPNKKNNGQHHHHHKRPSYPECAARDKRAIAVKEAFSHAYNGYKKYAWGHDELKTVSNQPSDSRNHWGATIIDALDTMIIMGLDEEYEYALKNFIKTLNFDKSNAPSKGFETSIRYLGGLLSAYDLKGDKILLDKAVELTEKVLMPLFDTPSGAPYTNFNVNSNKPERTSTIILAEFGTYTLEFTRLSQLTGNPKYATVANAIVEKTIAEPSRMAGLYPITWSVNPFKPVNNSIVNVGAGGDSFYEYLIKNYVISDRPNKDLLNAWVTAVNSIEDYLLSPTEENPDIQFIASITNQTVNYRSDELICFWPGNILLGMSQMSGDTSRQQKFAQTFMDSCIETWVKTATGLAPEVWAWHPKTPATEKSEDPNIWMHIKDIVGKGLLKRNTVNKQNGVPKKRDLSGRPFQIASASYNLRPETIESVFYYDRVVGGPRHDPDYYKNIGWNMFQGIEKYTRTNSGYSSIRNVDDADAELQGPNKLDFQESFLFAETLKYLYLLFSDDSCMSLDHYVFSTEAHPFKMPRSISLQKSSHTHHNQHHEP